MSKTPEGAKHLKTLATRVGGKQGKTLAAAVDAALKGAPDTDIRTRMASSQMQNALNALGAYASGPVPIKIKKRMRKDGQIRFALAAAKSPLLGAPMHFETRSTETRALLNQVFVDSGFIRALMESALNAVDFGFQNHEALWERQEDYKTEWSVPAANGGEEVKSKTAPVLYVPTPFKDLDPELTQLVWDDKGVLLGSVFGVPERFTNPDDLKAAIAKKAVNVLDVNKMFLFTPINEYQNYYGEGRLDWAYDHWYWQNILYLVAMRWYERKADPPWVGYAPSNAETPADPAADASDDDTQQDSLGVVLTAMGQLRSGGQTAIPSEPFMDEEGKPSNVRAWEIKEMEVRDIHPAFLEMLDHMDKKKARALLVPDTIISRDKQVASLGAVDAVADVASQIQNGLLQAFIRAFNQQVLSRFLAYNNIKDRATLVSTGIHEDSRGLLKEMILKAFEADMLLAQAGGRQVGGLDQIFDRRGSARAIGIPVMDVDPNAPPPKPILPVSNDTRSNSPAAKAGAKRDNGLAVEGEGGKALDTPTDSK